MVLRWRGAKNIGIYGFFLFRKRKKSRIYHLFDAFSGFTRIVDLTIAKSTNYKHNNDNGTKQQQL